MKRLIKRMTALVLAMIVLCGTVAGSYKEVQASDFSAGALQYGIDLSFLQSLFMAGGASLGLDMLLKTQNDINNWDWGDVLDSPASQGQIDSANEKIESLYNNAVKDWYDKHGGSSKPTPTPMITEPPAPGVTPPVTVAPINPDDVTMPDDWATMKKNATDKGVLAMGAATAYCVKEAVKGWWDDLVYNHDKINGYTIDNFDQLYTDSLGMYQTFDGSNRYCVSFLEPNDNIIGFRIKGTSSTNTKIYPIFKTSYSGSKDIFMYCYYFPAKYSSRNGRYVNSGAFEYYASNQLLFYNFNVPLYDSNNNLINVLNKSSLWPSIDLKDDYDNNNSLPSPSYPNLAVPSITLPTLDEIKDLWKQGSDDEENRPTYVTNFITNHTVQPTPEPEPTKKPEVNPNPGGGTDPNPKPSASPTPAVNPDPGGDGGTDPDPNPDPNPEEEASPYKADLREVFPFCIPFDLIHLLKVFEADAEAPVFEFPLDIELDNPWTGEKVVDYHHTFELDMSDYEPVIKILRIFQVVFFIIALMLITRQQMIKG